MASVPLLERSATVNLDRVLFLFGVLFGVAFLGVPLAEVALLGVPFFGVPLVGAIMPLRQVGCGTVKDL